MHSCRPALQDVRGYLFHFGHFVPVDPISARPAPASARSGFSFLASRAVSAPAECRDATCAAMKPQPLTLKIFAMNVPEKAVLGSCAEEPNLCSDRGTFRRRVTDRHRSF